ncbi:unnamed protein product [Echinostoma caproni]|uniref:Coiled-coil domain-containing protein 124 n=1 Tax=Echinostoma caproni TaxID=27848 RepID=A0A183B6Q9_9TREM|nr:unnamed protein product [Echinostoma caproni]
MPKKLGTCPKALEARERRAEKKKEEKEKKERELEEAYWKDEDKHVNKKLQRKDERDEKRQEQLDKKKEKERLYAQELAEIKAAKGANVKSCHTKLTQAQIASAREALAEQLAALNKKQTKKETEEIQPNVNRMEVEGLEARNVEEAIAQPLVSAVSPNARRNVVKIASRSVPPPPTGETYEKRRELQRKELQQKEEEMRQLFVQRVKEKEQVLKEAEREVSVVLFVSPIVRVCLFVSWYLWIIVGDSCPTGLVALKSR